MKPKQNSSLRIAAILGDRLFQGIRYEGKLLPLTPSRVDTVLEFGKPDMLLVESVRHSIDGFWNTSFSAKPVQQEMLTKAVKTARANEIPTVFWLTVGLEKLEEYREAAELFDFIACADLRATENLVREGRKAIYLPPCVQTAIFNPFRHLNDKNEPELNIVFDKGTDLIAFNSVRSAVESLNCYGLSVFESRPPNEEELSSLSNIAESNLAFTLLTPEARLAALKNAKAYISFGTSTRSWTEQQWMALEAAACRMAIVHLGRLEANDLLSDVLVDCSSEEEFLLEFYRHSKDSLYRERIAHLSWRYVNENHTFSHRIAQLCRELGLIHDWVEYPKVSVITPTYRKELLKRCIDNYEIFDYPNKELVIVFNGNELPDANDLGISERNDIIVTYVPSDLFAGAALNMGHLTASGRYFFRVDDDDYYGENYLTDMVLAAKAIDADLFAKPSAPLLFEGDKNIYVKEKIKEYVILTVESIHNGSAWLGGNSISGLSEFFVRNPYSDVSYGAADSSLQLNIQEDDTFLIVMVDKFNNVAWRNQDVSLHTWRDSADKLIKNRIILSGINELMI